MSRSQRMEPIRQIAGDKADAAAKALAAVQQRLAEQRLRLQQLEEFRAQYQEQRMHSGEAGIDSFRLRDYNAFVGRIDTAVKQQQGEVKRIEAEAEQKRQQWIALFGKARALEKVVERYTDIEQQEAERREQQENDAFAQRRRIELQRS